MSVAGVCLCLHQPRSGEKAERGGVCRARSLTVVPKQHGYCGGDYRHNDYKHSEVRGKLRLVALPPTYTHTLSCGDPKAPASYHPHTHPSCLDTK